MPIKKDYFKEYYKKNRDALNKYKREYYKDWRQKNKEIVRLKQQVYTLKNKEKVRAASIANRFIKIPKGQICQKCKGRPAVERHHSDYSKPLKVIFVCRQCHYKLNNQGRKEN